MEISIGKVLLLIYLAISSNFLVNLYTKSIKEELKNNKFLQHILLIVLIMSMIIITNSDIRYTTCNNYFMNVVILTVIIYIWFIMMMKMDIGWQLSILLLLLLYFVYDTKKDRDTELLIKDNNLDMNKKIEINKFNTMIENYGILIIFGITAIGTILYDSEKQIQYGGGYNLKTFLFD
jgi:hypothetical protein